MKLIDIVKEALHLLFATDEDLSARSLSSLRSDEAVGDLARAVPGSVNRALADLERRGALPSERVTLDSATAEKVSGSLAFSLDALPYYGELRRVVTRLPDGRTETTSGYTLEGKTLFLPAGDAERTITVLYAPTVPRVGDASDAETVLRLPENLAALLPLYVASELSADENPALAADLFARYETALAAAERPGEGTQSCVKAVYTLAERL